MSREWDPVLLLGGALVGSALLTRYLLSSNQQQLPGPKGHWLKGNLDLLKAAKETRNAYLLYTQLAKEHGPIYQLTVPGQRVIMICDPKTIHSVLNDIDTFWPSPRLVDSFGTVASGSLITLGGSLWKAHKKLLVGTFAPAQLRYATDLENNLVDQMISKWEKIASQPINVHQEFSALIWDTLGLLAFSHKFESLSNGATVMDDFAFVVQGLDKRLAVPKYLWNWVLSDQEEFTRRANSLRQVARDLVIKRRQDIERGESPNQPDLLQRILEEKTEDGHQLTDEQVINEMILFFIAGFETTSNCLCWVVYRLSQKPQFIEKLREEIRDVYGDDLTITFESLPKLRFLDAILKETLRLYPTVPLIGRYMTEDSSFLGYSVPKGTNLILNLHAAHHDQNLFSNPYEFDPTRWTKMEEGEPHFYFPFGGGPKTCIGNKLAWVELKVATVKLFHKFDISLAPGQEISPVHTLTLGPKDRMFVNVSPRF